MTKKTGLLLLALVTLSIGCSQYKLEIKEMVLPEPELYNLVSQKEAAQEWDNVIATIDRYERLYVNGPNIQELRLKRADAQFKKGGNSALIMAKGEYQNFLALYPRYNREDYLWLQIAKCSVQQMLPPNRDQGPTKAAIKDLETFIEKFPNSDLMGEAREQLNQAYSNLSNYHAVVGDHYYSRNIFPAAAQRYVSAVNSKGQLENEELVMRKLCLSLARTGIFFGEMYKYSSKSDRQAITDFYKAKHESTLYEAKKYLADYKAKFPENSGHIAAIEAEVNMIPPIEGEK